MTIPAWARMSPSVAVTVTVASNGVSGPGLYCVFGPVAVDSVPPPNTVHLTAEESPVASAVSSMGDSPTVMSLRVATISRHDARLPVAGTTERVTVADAPPDEAVTTL